MQIVSEIAEIVASAIDCVLVLWFLIKSLWKKRNNRMVEVSSMVCNFIYSNVILWEKYLIYKVL